MRAFVPYIVGAVLMGGAGFGLIAWGNGRYDDGVTFEADRWEADQAELRAELLFAQGELVALRTASLARIDDVLDAVERMDGDTAARARWAEGQLRKFREANDNVEIDTNPCAAVRIPDDSLRVHEQADDFLRTLRDNGASDPDGPDQE